MSLLIVWLVIFSILVYKFAHNTILYTPVIVMTNRLSYQLISVNPVENHYLVLLSYSLMFFFVFLAFWNLVYYKKVLISPLQRILLFFVFLLIAQSLIGAIDTFLSFKRSMPIITSILVFIALYERPDLYRYHFNIIRNQCNWFIGLFVVNVVLLTAFSIGSPLMAGDGTQESYAVGFIRLGVLTIYELHGIAIIISIFLLMNRKSHHNRRFLLNIIYISAIIILLLILKRTYFFILFAGFTGYFILSMHVKLSYKRIFSIQSIVLLVILVIMAAGYLSIITSQRNREISIEAYESEGRLKEFVLYPEVVINQSNPTAFVLLGKDLFVSGQFEILNKGIYQGSKSRFLHNDYAHLLYGSGIVGVALYLNILIRPILIARRIRKKSFTSLSSVLYVGIVLLVLTIIISGFGDGILLLLNRIAPLYFIGFMLSIMRNEIKLKHKDQLKTNSRSYFSSPSAM